MTDMSEISAEGLNHYTIVYDLNSSKLKDKVAGQWSAYLNTMEDSFSNIHAFGAGYERGKGYNKAFSWQDRWKVYLTKEVKHMLPTHKISQWKK